jgi:hypothetical protein
MDTTDYAAIYAAVLSTVVAGWNIYKQVTSGPKLVGFVTSGMTTPAYPLGNKFIAISISNRGSGETTLAGISVVCYKKRIISWQRKTVKQAVITPKLDVLADRLPHKLGPGDEFRTFFEQNNVIEDWSRKYISYLCIWHSMNNNPVKIFLKSIQIKSQQNTCDGAENASSD